MTDTTRAGAVRAMAKMLDADRARFMQYGPRTALRIHSSDREALEAHVEVLGGKIMHASSTYRWLVYGEELSQLLREMQPLLVKPEAQKRVSQALVLLEREANSPRLNRRHDGFLERADEPAETSSASGSSSGKASPEVLLRPSEAIHGHVPPGPWYAEGEPILMALTLAGPEDSVWVAASEVQASSWAAHALEHGFRAEVEGRLVRVHATLKNASSSSKKTPHQLRTTAKK